MSIDSQTKLDRQSLISTLTPLLKGKVLFAYLFGSAAKDRMHSESDIDLAVYMKKHPITLSDKSELKDFLSAHVTRELDLIYLNDADPIISMQVLKTGESFSVEDAQKLLEFKTVKISEYIDFKQSRKIIEDSLLTKGWPQWKKTT